MSSPLVTPSVAAFHRPQHQQHSSHHHHCRRRRPRTTAFSVALPNNSSPKSSHDHTRLHSSSSSSSSPSSSSSHLRYPPHRRHVIVHSRHHPRPPSSHLLPLTFTFLLLLLSLSLPVSSTSLHPVIKVKVNVKQCPPGNFFNSSSTQCSPCPPGTYSSTTSSSSICTSCPLGTSQPLFGAQHFLLCRPCYPNTYASSTSSTICTSCPPGTISGFASSRCVRCPKGMHVTFIGNASCKPCPNGEYSDKPNAATCNLCIEDKLDVMKQVKNNGRNMNMNVGCDKCVKVMKNGSKRNVCGKCELNMYREYNSGNGQQVGDGRCKECPLGTDTVAKKGWAGSKSMCMPCKPGFKRARFDYQCVPCPHGVIQAPGRGAMYCRSVIEQPSESSTTTSTAVVSTTKCDSSYIAAFVNADGVCVSCLPGHRRDISSNTCIRCPSGSVSLGGILTTCDECPTKAGAQPLPDSSRCTCGDGYVYSRYTRSCGSCVPGTFRSDDLHLPDQGGCIPCSYGWVSANYGSKKCTRCAYGMIAYTPGRPQNEERLNVGDTMCKRCDEEGKGEVAELLSFTALYYKEGQTKCVNGRTLQGQFSGYDGSGTPKENGIVVSDLYYHTGFKPVDGQY